MQNQTPLILLHGALGSAKQFDSIAPQLFLYFDVHILNFDGHGGETIPTDGFSLEMFRNAILKYMDENEINTAHFFGYSMGGYIAISFAIEFPERVKSIMTLATKFDWTETTAAAEMKMLNPLTMIQKVPNLVETLKQRHAPENWEVVVNKTREFIGSLGLHPLSENDFRNVKCNVRVMVGDRDKMVSVVESQYVYKLFLSGSFVVLPETQHPFEAVKEKRLIYEMESFFI